MILSGILIAVFSFAVIVMFALSLLVLGAVIMNGQRWERLAKISLLFVVPFALMGIDRFAVWVGSQAYELREHKEPQK